MLDFCVTMRCGWGTSSYHELRGACVDQNWLNNKIAQDKQKFEAKREEDKRFNREQELKTRLGKNFWAALRDG
jgi:hypothetical protein